VSAAAGLRLPPGRQGPGPLRPALVEALDVALVRRGAGALPGDRVAAGAGAGTELTQLRPYVPGDDPRQLDAAASARTGVAHVRLHVPERTLTTWIVLDRSASMAFGTADRLKCDVAEGVALVLGRLATRRGGRLGVLTAGGPERLLAPRGGRGAVVGLQRLIGEGVAPDGDHGPGGDAGAAVGGALQRLGRVARGRGLVVVVSDLRGERGWEAPLRALALRHAVLAVEVRDPWEEGLPAAGRLALVDPESGRRLELDTARPALRERFAQAAAQEREEVAAGLRRAQARHVVLSTRGDWLRRLGRALA
jgi:uncharacterized protein (DUF58 family)